MAHTDGHTQPHQHPSKLNSINLFMFSHCHLSIQSVFVHFGIIAISWVFEIFFFLADVILTFAFYDIWLISAIANNDNFISWRFHCSVCYHSYSCERTNKNWWERTCDCDLSIRYDFVYYSVVYRETERYNVYVNSSSFTLRLHSIQRKHIYRATDNTLSGPVSISKL